jgi:predicted amidophosphoribosyltransferase
MVCGMMDEPGVDIHVTEHAKCQRCWQYLSEVGKIYKWPDLCWRCADVMDSFEKDRPELYDKWIKAMTDHPMRKYADEHPEIKRLLSKAGDVLEIWFPKEVMTWAEFM